MHDQSTVCSAIRATYFYRSYKSYTILSITSHMIDLCRMIIVLCSVTQTLAPLHRPHGLFLQFVQSLYNFYICEYIALFTFASIFDYKATTTRMK
jgi:hypothetical protein